jgi:hypothetical protein
MCVCSDVMSRDVLFHNLFTTKDVMCCSLRAKAHVKFKIFCVVNPVLKKYGVVRFEVLMSVNIHVIVLLVMTPCNLVDVCSPPTRRHGTYPEHPSVL